MTLPNSHYLVFVTADLSPPRKVHSLPMLNAHISSPAATDCSYSEPVIYIWYTHVLSCISLPLGGVVFWLVFTKSPAYMREMQTNLIMNHCFTWSFEILMFTITPEFYFPALSGRILGIWDSIFGFGVRQAFSLGGGLTMLANVSITQLFTYKYQSLLSPGQRMRVSKRAWALVIGCMYVCLFVIVTVSIEIFPFTDDRNSTAFRNMFSEYPCLLLLNATPFVYAITMEPLPGIGIAAVSIFIVMVLSLIVCITTLNTVCIDQSYKLLEAATFMSASTKALQKKFLTALWIQTSVPFIGFSVPWLYYAFVVSVALYDPYPAVNNFFFGLMCTHGFFASFFLIFLNEPYRRALKEKYRTIRGFRVHPELSRSNVVTINSQIFSSSGIQVL